MWQFHQKSWLPQIIVFLNVKQVKRHVRYIKRNSYLQRSLSNHHSSLCGVYCHSCSQAASVYVLFLHKPRTKKHDTRGKSSMLHKWTSECASAADFCLTGRVYCRHQRNGYFLRSHEELFNVWIEVGHNNNKKKTFELFSLEKTRELLTPRADGDLYVSARGLSITRARRIDSALRK